MFFAPTCSNVYFYACKYFCIRCRDVYVNICAFQKLHLEKTWYIWTGTYRTHFKGKGGRGGGHNSIYKIDKSRIVFTNIIIFLEKPECSSFFFTEKKSLGIFDFELDKMYIVGHVILTKRILEENCMRYYYDRLLHIPQKPLNSHG